MSSLSLVFGLMAAIGAAIAAFYAYKASTVQPRPVWEDDPKLEPKNLSEHTFGMMNALGAAQFWAGKASTKAALWGIGAAIFGLLSAAFAWA